MTAEIVIMNKSAVALAADSAVTVRDANSRGKIFNTANKVFSLSKYAPVGIMVSGGASVMGVPWEIIVKTFRDELKTDKFDTINDYCDRFFNFVDQFPFEADAEKQHIGQIAYSIFNDICKRMDSWVTQELSEKDTVTELEILVYLQSQIEEVSSLFSQNSDRMGILDGDTLNQLHDRYRDELDSIIKMFFEKHALSKENHDQLRRIAVHASHVGPQSSGIVIAGFGEKEYYPRCRSFYVGGVVAKHTIRSEDMNRQYKVGAGASAAILPFAQRNEVNTFIEGVSPVLSRVVTETFREIFGEHGELPQKLCDEIASKLGLQQDTHDDLQSSLGRICQGAYETAVSKFYEESQKNHLNPILETTAVLNKDELARMAETLINLESFRKQVVLDEETVGGPIDVAVITKGDGLIWIKRKHYFQPELNHHFFRNYFRNYPHTTFEGDEQ